MKKVIFLTILGLSTAFLAVAQNGYEKIQGGADEDWFRSVFPTKDKGSIACGGTHSYGFGDVNNFDGYIVKMNSDGDSLWTRHFGSTSNDEAGSVIENSFGYLISGYIVSPINGSLDFYAVQYDVDGNQLWENYYGGASTEYCLDAIQGAHKQTVLCGSSYSFTNGALDLYAVKIDSNGNQVNDAHFGGAGNENAYAGIHTSNGGYAFLGYSNSSDPIYNIYLVKTDSDLNFLWSKEFGGIYQDVGQDLAEDASGNLWIVGFETISPDSSYMVVIKTDANGENEATFHPGTHGGDFGNSIHQTSDGGFLIGGVTSVFGKGSEMLLEKLNSNGDTLWTRHFGGSKNEYGYSVTTDDSGNIYLAGETEGFGAEQFDGYIVKLDSLGNAPCPTTVSFTQSASEICEDENVFFNNTTISSQPFSWTVDGNEFSDDVDAGYYFNSSGSYSIALNSCVVSSSHEITVNSKPATHFTYVESGDTVAFTLDPGVDVQIINWNFGDGSPLNTTDLNPTHIYPFSGEYWVVVTITNAAGCDSIFAEQIDVSTGINDIETDRFILFPNPANEKVYIEGNVWAFVTTITVIGIDGRLQKTLFPQQPVREVSLEGIAPGIYFLKFECADVITSLNRLEVY